MCICDRVLLIFAFIVHICHCFIPNVCKHNVTKNPAYCCPVPHGYTAPCGYPYIGICSEIQFYKPYNKNKFQRLMAAGDMRAYWPNRVFSHGCECRGRRWGFDCGKCWFGYEGKNCDKRVIRTRRNVNTYTSKEKRELVDVLLMSRKVKSEYVLPEVRYNETSWTGKFMDVDIMEEIDITHWFCGFGKVVKSKHMCHVLEGSEWNYGHYDSGFLTYHRYMMTYWESLLRAIAVKKLGYKDFTFPYWDWFNTRQCDICTDDLIGKASTIYDSNTDALIVSNSSPFGNISLWPVYCQKKRNVDNVCAPCIIDRKNPKPLTRSWAFDDFPTVEELIHVLEKNQLQNYENPCLGFTSVLEAGWNCTCTFKNHPYGLHSNVHGFNKGTLSDLAASVFDPLFILHHIQVDRIFERWFGVQTLHPRTLPNHPIAQGECRDCKIGTFYPSTKHRTIFGSAKMVGYKYDNLNFGTLSEKNRVGDPLRSSKPPACEVQVIPMIRMLEDKST